MYMYMRVFLFIIQVPLFQGTELGFTKMLSLYIQPLLVPKGEYIVRKGDIGEEVNIIVSDLVSTGNVAEEKAEWWSVFLTIKHCVLNNGSIKTHSSGVSIKGFFC